jgi:3-oxoacyl-[acyl-carrier protein] reductase
LDMTKLVDAEDMAGSTIAKYGRIDMLINVAGGSRGRFIREKIGPFADSSKEEWDRIIDINLNGARNCTRSVINQMITQRYGKIVNFSSVAGVEGAINAVDYSAAKAGIIGFTKALALEMGPYGIQVNSVCPWGVLTERIRTMLTKQNLGKDQKSLETEFNKYAKPEEIAKLVLFLVSDDVSHISGENIMVAGGRSH